MIRIDEVSRARIFISYAIEHTGFVSRVASLMRRFLDHNQVFTYRDADNRLEFDEINAAKSYIDRLMSPDVLPVFMQFTMSNRAISPGQDAELNEWNAFRSSRDRNSDFIEIQVVLPLLPDGRAGKWTQPTPSVGLLHQDAKGTVLPVQWMDPASADWVAERTLRFLLFRQTEIPFDTQLSDYEKTTIDKFRRMSRPLSTWTQTDRDECLPLLEKGFPFNWPSVGLRCGPEMVMDKNPLMEAQVGKYRNGLSPLFEKLADSQQGGPQDAVVASALTGQHETCMMRESLVFLEAGPRQMTNRGGINVGVLVSGGIAPGVNAVIDGIVRRHEQYRTTRNIYGIRHGFLGLRQWDIGHRLLQGEETSGRATQGGSWLETFRLKEIQEGDHRSRPCFLSMIHTLKTQNISILYVIGGDGSMKAAHRLARYARREGFQLSVVGIPKTMDNDILWVWQSFGFATAVEKAREIIQNLSTELISNPRMCFLQLFGSASGFVVSHAVAASQAGHCDIALVPEVKFTIKRVARRLAQKIAASEGGRPRPIPYGLVVMAEAAIPEDWRDYRVLLDEDQEKAVEDYRRYRESNQYPPGQTSDELRSAGLKLVTKGVMFEIKELFEKGAIPKPPNVEIYLTDNRFRAFANEPRHVLRATSPSFADIITGQRLGALAVDNAMAGYTDFMISQWLTEFVLVPLRLVSMGRKHVPEEGIFWKSVLAKTEQGCLEDS